MIFGGKTSIVKQVKEAFNADKSKHRATRAILAATKHNSKTIEKLNKLLLKKTKKLERYRAAKRLRPSSSSDSHPRSRSRRSRSSESSSDGELAVIMALQNQINKNANAANAVNANVAQPLTADPYNLHDYTYMDPLLGEPARAPTSRRSVYGNNYGPMYGNTYGTTHGNKNVHIYFDIRHKYISYGAVRLTPTQRMQVSDYINSFAAYLVKKAIIHRVVSSATSYNTHEFQIHVNMPNENKNKLKVNLGYYRRSAVYHPVIMDTYDVEITSVS